MFSTLRGIKRIPPNLFTRSRLFPSFPNRITYNPPNNYAFYQQIAKYSTEPKNLFNEPVENKVESKPKTEIQQMIDLIDEWVKANTKKSSVFQVILSYVIKPIISVIIFIIGLKYVLGSIGENPIAKTLQTTNYTAKKNTGVTFDDIKGIDSVKAELELIVKFLKNPDEFEDIGAEIPKGILLYGPPGTGKTLLARAIANEADATFLFANASSFEEMFVGVGSRRVKKLFETAKAKAPCIVYIDELDALGGNRAKMRSSSPSLAINQLLTELDGFEPTQNIIFIGSSNRIEALDPALIRPGRIDKLVHVPLPDRTGRTEILKYYLEKKKYEGSVKVEDIAKMTIGFSGAKLASLINQAAIFAVLDGKNTLNNKHLHDAFTEIIFGIKRPISLTEEDRRVTAIHESGHALVTYFSPNSSPIFQATILPRGEALGSVFALPGSEDSMTKAEILTRLDIAQGGRAAEELIFGPEQVHTGCSADYAMAQRLLDAYVINIGFSPLGLVATDKEHLSNEMKESVEKEMQKLVKESYQRVKNILETHKKELELLADTLMVHETLTGEQISNLINTGDIGPEKEWVGL